MSIVAPSQDTTCMCERDDAVRQDALMRSAHADDQLFCVGAYVDQDGRDTVGRLVRLNYPLTVAMRVAIQLQVTL